MIVFFEPLVVWLRFAFHKTVAAISDDLWFDFLFLCWVIICFVWPVLGALLAYYALFAQTDSMH